MTIEILRRLHRWISLLLAPPYLVIVLSGGLLTLEPILGVGASRPGAPLDTATLTRTLGELEIAGTARLLSFDSIKPEPPSN